MPNIEQELQEFVDEVTGKYHPDEPWQAHVHHMVREGIDVVGHLLQANENVDELSDAATNAATKIVQKLDMRPMVKRMVLMAIPGVMPGIVEQLAAYAGTAQQFVDAEIIPRLDEWINTLVDVRQAIASPPIMPPA
jgi:hypothetical protein